MLNRIGLTYETISSVIGIIFGILIIVFRQKFLQTMMRGLSRRDDVLSQTMLETWQNKSEKRASMTAILVGLVFIIISLLQLLRS